MKLKLNQDNKIINTKYNSIFNPYIRISEDCIVYIQLKNNTITIKEKKMASDL